MQRNRPSHRRAIEAHRRWPFVIQIQPLQKLHERKPALEKEVAVEVKIAP